MLEQACMVQMAVGTPRLAAGLAEVTGCRCSVSISQLSNNDGWGLPPESRRIKMNPWWWLWFAGGCRAIPGCKRLGRGGQAGGRRRTDISPTRTDRKQIAPLLDKSGQIGPRWERRDAHSTESDLGHRVRSKFFVVGRKWQGPGRPGEHRYFREGSGVKIDVCNSWGWNKALS